MTTTPPKRRRWFQFRLRTVLIAVLVLSLPLSWLAVRLERARRQKPALLAVEQAGGIVLYDWQLTPTATPPLLSRCFGYEFCHVPIVSFNHADFDAAVLVHLKDIYNLRTLWLDWSSIHDEGLRHLAGLDSVRGLALSYTPVTDAGLVHLTRLPNLKHLELQGTSITDAGLEQLAAETNLTHLDLLGVESVSEEAVKRFQAARPDCQVLTDYGEPD